MEIIYADKNNFDQLIKGRVLVEFYTTWCAPCKMLDIDLNEIKDKIQVVKVDAEANREISKKYGVMSVPTMIYFNNGKEDVKKGYMTSSDILNWIEK